MQYTGGFDDYFTYSKSKHSWGFIIEYDKFKQIINNCKINVEKILDEKTLVEPVEKLCDIMMNINTKYIVFDFHGELIDINKEKIEKVECICNLCNAHSNKDGSCEAIICGELKCM